MKIEKAFRTDLRTDGAKIDNLVVMRGGKGDTSYVKLINFFEISPYISKGDLSVLRFVCLLLVMLSA